MVRMSPGSGASPPMSNTTKSVEMSNGFTQSQDLAGLEHSNPGGHQIPSFPTGQPEYPRHLQPFLIDDWCRDGPWTPFQSDPALSSILGNLRPHPNVLHYRSNAVPSECSTAILPPSDSGYASYGAKHSVANNSVCDDTFERSTETRSVVGPLNELHLSQPTDLEPLSRGSIDHGLPVWAMPQAVTKHADHQTQLIGRIVCNHCNKTLKTKSELK